MNGASLAACQKNAIAPTRVAIAIHVVCEAASAVHAAHAMQGNAAPAITPENIRVRYDATVELIGAPPPTGAEATRSGSAYLAPEQVAGGAVVDLRANVFSLGVVLWELLTATNLFARDTPAATRTAIIEDPVLDVRDVNPDVPVIVGEVLATALQREPTARFETPQAFCTALKAARDASALAAATKHEIVAWVAELVPPALRPAAAAAAVPDLDVGDAGRARRPSAGGIPALDVDAMAAAALAPPASVPDLSFDARPSASVPGRAPLPRPTSSPERASVASAPAISPVDDGTDDFDMEIERNVASTSMPTATSSRGPASQSGAARAGGGSGGLELAAPSRMAREEAARHPRGFTEPTSGEELVGIALSLAIAGGTAFAMWKYVHHAGGFDVTRAMPHAFDGTSATESGAFSLVSLVLAVFLGYFGLKAKPHAWAVIAAGGVTLLLALAMVTVTLASTGENPTPPDGALLVPWLLPAAVLVLAFGLVGRAGRLFALGGSRRRAAFVPVAIIAGAIAFAAFEASRFAR